MPKRAKRLYTIGYEGIEIGDLIGALSKARVRVLIDVRQLPLSRRKGFSKTALAQSLVAHGIAYKHLRDLGDPKPGRDAARSGDYAKFRKIFAAHLGTKRAQEALSDAIKIATTDRTCLLCFERDPVHCHRSIVATQIQTRARLSIDHLILSEHDGRADQKNRNRANAGIGQSFTAAE